MLVNRAECIKKMMHLCEKSTKITTAGLEESARYRSFHYALYDMYDGMEYDILSFGGKRDILSMRKSPLWDQIAAYHMQQAIEKTMEDSLHTAYYVYQEWLNSGDTYRKAGSRRKR